MFFGGIAVVFFLVVFFFFWGEKGKARRGAAVSDAVFIIYIYRYRYRYIKERKKCRDFFFYHKSAGIFFLSLYLLSS